MQIKGQTIWVTGASSGMGRALALALAQAGNHVIASGRNETALKRLEEQASGTISRLPVDLTDDASISKARQQLHVLTDQLDMVIVNAGDCEYLDVKAFDHRLVERVFAINFQGAVRTIDTALELLNKRREARIVFISSLSTLLPFARAEAYGASKAALEYFAKSMAIDLAIANSGLKVCIVRPGFVKTALTDKNTFHMPFLIAAEDAANRIIHGLEKGRSNIAFPRRLNWALKILALFPLFWQKHLAPVAASDRSQAW